MNFDMLIYGALSSLKCLEMRNSMKQLAGVCMTRPRAPRDKTSEGTRDLFESVNQAPPRCRKILLQSGFLPFPETFKWTSSV